MTHFMTKLYLSSLKLGEPQYRRFSAICGSATTGRPEWLKQWKRLVL
jgi:hypothetical protein